MRTFYFCNRDPLTTVTLHCIASASAGTPAHSRVVDLGLAARPGLLPDASRTLAGRPVSGPYRQVGQLSATVSPARPARAPSPALSFTGVRSRRRGRSSRPRVSACIDAGACLDGAGNGPNSCPRSTPLGAVRARHPAGPPGRDELSGEVTVRCVLGAPLRLERYSQALSQRPARVSLCALAGNTIDLLGQVDRRPGVVAAPRGKGR
jgi:hypothetical protein